MSLIKANVPAVTHKHAMDQIGADFSLNKTLVRAKIII